jgi:hypothetical protein
VADTGGVSGWLVPEQFAIYGLPERAWSGPRWLNAADSGGDEGRGAMIMVDHGRDPWLFSRADPWVSVGTTNERTATTERDLARFGLVLLVGSHEQPHYSPPLSLGSWMWVGRNRVKPLVERFDAWERATWQVDGAPTEARFTQFASAMVAVATVPADSVVLVLGCGIDPDGLRLETQTDSSRYHFDRTHPITEDTCDRARRAAFGDALVDSGPPSDIPVEPDLIPATT